MERYPVLRFSVSATKVLSWVLGLTFVFAGYYEMSSHNVRLFIAFWAAAILGWVYTRAVAELIRVFVQIEENTRPRT